MFIYSSEKKPVEEKKLTIVVWKQVPIPVLLEAITLCGLRKGVGFYQQETSSLFTAKQPDTWVISCQEFAFLKFEVRYMIMTKMSQIV